MTTAQRGRDARGRILVGTTSWSDKTLIAHSQFYPQSVKTAEQRLRYYASVFPIVEIDSTFYAIPGPHNARLWTQRTAPGFVFDVKCYRLFTQHRTPVASLPADVRKRLDTQEPSIYCDKLPEEIRGELWQRFRAALEPLRASKRLGVVLCQFAPWVVFGKRGLAQIEHCAQQMSGLRVAVELRNVSWLGDKHRAQTLDFLRQRGLTHVVVDEPQGTSFSVPTVWEATSPEVEVFRLHGRNRGMWQQKGLVSASERFAYQYDEQELTSFVEPVQRLAQRTKELHVLFNNCHDDWAQRNATRFTELLAARTGPTQAAAAQVEAAALPRA